MEHNILADSLFFGFHQVYNQWEKETSFYMQKTNQKPFSDIIFFYFLSMKAEEKHQQSKEDIK